MTFESEEKEEDKDEADDATAASSPTPSPFSSTTFADDAAEAVAAVEVARVVDKEIGMDGFKSSSSPAPRPPPAFFAVIVDFAADDDILRLYKNEGSKRVNDNISSLSLFLFRED